MTLTLTPVWKYLFVVVGTTLSSCFAAGLAFCLGSIIFSEPRILPNVSAYAAMILSIGVVSFFPNFIGITILYTSRFSKLLFKISFLAVVLWGVLYGLLIYIISFLLFALPVMLFHPVEGFSMFLYWMNLLFIVPPFAFAALVGGVFAIWLFRVFYKKVEK